MLHFVHVRKRNKSYEPVPASIVGITPMFSEISTVAVKGGNTVAYVFDDAGKRLLFSAARCSKKDNYCKRTGRELSASRLGEHTKQFSVAYSDLPDGKPTYKNISAYFYNLLKDS